MYQIIVPIDFSQESLVGLDLAILLSRKVESQIQMIHVQKNNFIGYSGPKEDTAFIENEFAKIIEKYGSKLLPNTNLNYFIKSGKIYKEIVSLTETYEDSFVVASTHGASGFENLFLGSNAFRIISATKKPVFTIRGAKLPDTISKIVLPIDITSDTRQKVPFTAEIAKLFNAEIHVVTLASFQTSESNNKLNSYSKQVLEYLDSKEIPYKTETLIGANIIDLLLDYSNNIQAHLISIMTEQASDSSYIIGTAAHQILNRCEIPVLSMNPKALHVSSFS